MGKIFIILLVASAMFFLGSQRAIAQNIAKEEPAVTQEAGPVNVGNKICPVSGEKIEEKLKATYEHNGKIYNFCCVSCIEEFKKDPEKYIKKVDEELQVEAKGQSGYEEHDMGMMQESGTSHEEMQGSHHH